MVPFHDGDAICICPRFQGRIARGGQCDADRAQLSCLIKLRDERKVAPMNFRAVRISLIITIIPGMVG
jgi:hypothetical protein